MAATVEAEHERSCIREPVPHNLQTQKVVAVGMSDVDGCEILATLDEPVNQLLRVLDRQKRIDEDGIAFAINQRDCVRNPGQVFLAWRKSLGDTGTLLGQKLPIPLRHKLTSRDPKVSESVLRKTGCFNQTKVFDLGLISETNSRR
jgi:hypothetical protein